MKAIFERKDTFCMGYEAYLEGLKGLQIIRILAIYYFPAAVEVVEVELDLLVPLPCSQPGTKGAENHVCPSFQGTYKVLPGKLRTT